MLWRFTNIIIYFSKTRGDILLVLIISLGYIYHI